MKILQVVHLFVPRHRAGVEVYTDAVASELAREHEVTVFTTEHRPGAADYSLTRRRRGDVKVVEAIHNKNHASFEESYSNESMNRLFEAVLDETNPDVVHLQHLLFHSLDYVRIARERGIPVAMTLHEYWLICLRGGQMILPDLSRCPLPTARDCGPCAALGTGSASPLERAGDALLRGVKRVSGLDLWPLLRAVRIHSPYRVKRWLGLAPRPMPTPVTSAGCGAAANGMDGGANEPSEERRREVAEVAPEHVARVERRMSAVRAALDGVDHLIAPSPFLRDMFVRFGVDPAKITTSDYGFDVARIPESTQRESAASGPATNRPLRFGLIGSLIPVKGVHVAVEAFLGMSPGRARLVVRGTSSHRPDYVQELKRRASGHPIEFAGPFDNERIAEVLGEFDALLVPSVWYENSPLTIHEGFLAGIPVITSDLGGMKDLVRDGENGFLFRPGDASDLRRLVDELVDDRGRLAAARPDRAEVKPVAQDARELAELYRSLVGGRVAPRRGEGDS